ncbi:unnamed protein product [Dicrocoelium dendriticum]|nr:unnamed protein product [Dicrocoelium dendriticum]
MDMVLHAIHGHYPSASSAYLPSDDQSCHECDFTYNKYQTMLSEYGLSQTASCRTHAGRGANDKRLCKLRSQKIQANLEQIQTQLNTAQLSLTNSKLALKTQETEWRELLVECNLNRHQVKRMEGRLSLLRNKVLGEETKQLQLDALEREAGVELCARKNQITLELRQIESRLADTRAELTARKRRLEQVKSRYNVTMNGIASRDEDAMTARMRYLMEALQERQDLKHKGDELDVQVRLAEEELRALENTVVVMTSLNEVARSQLFSQEDEDPHKIEKTELEEKIQEAQTLLSARREYRRKLRGNIIVSLSSITKSIT